MTVTSLGIPVVRRGLPSVAGRPDVPELVDTFSRVARDLRISLTEKCSLRCTYCMPEEGLPVIAHSDLLTPDEVARLVGIAANDLGIREVRFTGGEPLMRSDLDKIIRLSSCAAPEVVLSMTTNALGLKHRAKSLVEAGLHRVNVSLDSIDRAQFAALTRRDRLPDTLAGIREARRAGLDPVKVNAVLMRETLDGAAELLDWSITEDVSLRFIEQMPLDADETWRRDNMVDAAELLQVLSARFELTPIGRDDPTAPAEDWLVDGGPHSVGIIASVTRPFCQSCDRTRITAEGTVRSCLFGDDETDLRSALRGEASDREIADLWRAAMWGKQAGHGMDAADFARPARSMGAIGG